jgi:GMP synthase (glutamine-hydrolysing)
MTDIHASRLLILDFGSQYTQLIARRVREAGVYSEIRVLGHGRGRDPRVRTQGIVLSGGPESVPEPDRPARPPACSTASAVLGICYGMQTMAAQLGGASRARRRASSATRRSARG